MRWAACPGRENGVSTSFAMAEWQTPERFLLCGHPIVTLLTRMTHLFDIGDVVQLKSGSPAMTVSGYDENRPHQDAYVKTIWFDGSQVEHNTFPEAALRQCEMPPSGVLT
jgi:uncharacterized protein YodC (DUF2158 family)